MENLYFAREYSLWRLCRFDDAFAIANATESNERTNGKEEKQNVNDNERKMETRVTKNSVPKIDTREMKRTSNG